jgi:hypothetical protein
MKLKPFRYALNFLTPNGQAKGDQGQKCIDNRFYLLRTESRSTRQVLGSIMAFGNETWYVACKAEFTLRSTLLIKDTLQIHQVNAPSANMRHGTVLIGA